MNKRTVLLTPEVYEMLKSEGIFGESYSQVLLRILKEYKILKKQVKNNDSWTKLFNNEAIKQLKEFEDNHQYFQSHYEELKSKYPNSYIAIDKCKVVDSQKILDIESFKELLERVKEKNNGEIGSIVIEPVNKFDIKFRL